VVKRAVMCLFAVSCGFPEPLRYTVDGNLDMHGDAPIDVKASDMQSDGPFTPEGDFEGAIATAGGVLASGSIEILDDGLEPADWACAASICVAGGVVP
jgi:hypothetical protein